MIEQNNIGLIIKELRLKKNLTQEQLAFGICSTSQLYRIEKGKHYPSTLILQQLSSKLGEDIYKYIMFSCCSNPLYFSNLFNNLEKLRLKRNYTEILKLISYTQNSSLYHYDINLPIIKQLLGWYKGVSLSNINANVISIDYYINLLKLTATFNNINELFNRILNINEIKIIHSISATYCREKKYKIAKDILESLINNINTFNVSSDFPLLPEIYYNLSKLLFIEKYYNESISFANKGIEFCINNNFSRILADLFYILGQCYEMLGEIDKSLQNYNKFIYLYDILGHDKFSLQCKENLLSKYCDISTLCQL